MRGMRLGGIDPSILRELSGVYKPFIKAVKELVSNSYDADADTVRLTFADDFSSLTVVDDGTGMTPFEFRNDFARIGGGSRRWTGDKTRKGRLRIGSKGIGFLALARYCDRLLVRSAATRTFERTFDVVAGSKGFDVASALGVPLSPELFARRVQVVPLRAGKSAAPLKPKQYRWDERKGRLSWVGDVGAVSVKVKADCEGLVFDAVLDFDQLLRLADTADLDKLDDFASIDVVERPKSELPRGTQIVADRLKPFVRRELRADRRKGFVRNIGSRSGLEQFHWHLSRCTPIAYVEPGDATNAASVTGFLTTRGQSRLQRLTVTHAGKDAEMRRPVYPFEAGCPRLPDDMVIKVDLNEGGVRATGFVAGFESVVFPAEYRGIAICVRGVQIGDAHFLGAEHLLTGANKAALSQISGEVNVLAGLDAADTLNPGRESFYEESDEYKVLRRHLVGEGEHVGGCLWRAITAVLKRSQVSSALADVLGKATMRRRALDDVSAAIAHLIGRGDVLSDAVHRMLRSKASDVNGLGDAPAFVLGAPDRIAGLAVVPAEHLATPAHVDYGAQQVKLDRTRPEWSWEFSLFDRQFEVVHKAGKPDQAIAEADLKGGKIYVNWGHPVKAQMDERGFLRFALAWVLAKHTPHDDSRQMMDLALQLLSFTTGGNG